jgi:hypothetical protein
VYVFSPKIICCLAHALSCLCVLVVNVWLFDAKVRTGMVKLLIELGQLDEAEEFARGLLVVDDL